MKTISVNQTELHYKTIHQNLILNEIATIEQKTKLEGFKLKIYKQVEQILNVYILSHQILNIYFPVSLGNQKIIATIEN